MEHDRVHWTSTSTHIWLTPYVQLPELTREPLFVYSLARKLHNFFDMLKDSGKGITLKAVLFICICLHCGLFTDSVLIIDAPPVYFSVNIDDSSRRWKSLSSRFTSVAWASLFLNKQIISDFKHLLNQLPYGTFHSWYSRWRTKQRPRTIEKSVAPPWPWTRTARSWTPFEKWSNKWRRKGRA